MFQCSSNAVSCFILSTMFGINTFARTNIQTHHQILLVTIAASQGGEEANHPHGILTPRANRIPYKYTKLDQL